MLRSTQHWDVKPCRGRQRKIWSRLVDNLVDKAEWLDEIEKGDCSLKAMVEESLGDRESNCRRS